MIFFKLQLKHTCFASLWSPLFYNYATLFPIKLLNNTEHIYRCYSHSNIWLMYFIIHLSFFFFLVRYKVEKDTWGVPKKNIELSVVSIKCVTLFRLLEIKTEYIICCRVPLLLLLLLLVKSSKVVGPASCTVTL